MEQTRGTYDNKGGHKNSGLRRGEDTGIVKTLGVLTYRQVQGPRTPMEPNLWGGGGGVG